MTSTTDAMVTAALEATAAKVSPKDANPFRKGDAVVYPTRGAGRIDRVGFEEIAGHRLNLIHISFEDNQMRLRVPVARARAAGLRRLASPKALAATLAIMRGRPRASRLLAMAPAAASANAFCLSLRSITWGGGFAAVKGIAKSDAIELLNEALVDARADDVIEPQISTRDLKIGW